MTTIPPWIGAKSLNANWLDWLTLDEMRDLLRPLDQKTAQRLFNDWVFWSRLQEQQPPDGPWHSWLFLGGRGAGKTRAGAEWLAKRAQKGIRCALVGASYHDVREVMIEGPSGLKAIAKKGNRPSYEVSRRRLRWPDGAVAYAFSAEDPDSLRGPQFNYAWADEFCAWRHPSETLAMLRLGLRLGETPQLCVTSTPKPIPALKTLMAEPGVVITRSGSIQNTGHISTAFVDGLNALYGGTRLAAQELDGLVLSDDRRALWRAGDLERCRGAQPPQLEEIVVAVDPPATASGDACGIVVAGRLGSRGYVLADETVSGQSPLGWAQAVVEAVAVHKADRVVAEVNQGGDMVRNVLRSSGCPVPIAEVRAHRGKRARAEPVAALYEQGRISHCGLFPQLEEELMALGMGELTHSPDRADALVWALTHLLVEGCAEPSVRRL